MDAGIVPPATGAAKPLAAPAGAVTITLPGKPLGEDMLPSDSQSARSGRRRLALRAALAAWAVACMIATFAAAREPTRTPRGFQAYPTKYYVIHTDLGVDVVREAALRMTAMAEEYHRRTKDFGGTIRRKLPFHLFRKAADYHDAGGPKNSAGVFTGEKLMAVAPARPTQGTWHTIQHEGFHQFARYAIRAPLPVWVNEGLAEYFGEGLFTGDGFVVGVVPPGRLRRLTKSLRDGKGKSLRDMMRMSHDDWNDEMDLANYDRAWSMIHFLVHADDGKYTKRLTRFINDTRRMRYEKAWARCFGRDVNAFEKKWRSYWLGQGENPTAEKYARASVATLSSFLARAAAAGQSFDTMQAFINTADGGKLKVSKKDWLPPSLLAGAMARAPGLGRWSLTKADSGEMTLTLTAPGGRTFTGAYVLAGGRVKSVRVTEAAPAPTTQPS